MPSYFDYIMPIDTTGRDWSWVSSNTGVGEPPFNISDVTDSSHATYIRSAPVAYAPKATVALPALDSGDLLEFLEEDI